MDLDHSQPPRHDSASMAAQGAPTLRQTVPADDQKEVAWAAFGLILWSGVVLIGLFGAAYILGHSILHLW